MNVHWELAQDLGRRPLEPEGIPNAHSQCFIRLSCESLLDLEPPQLLVLRNVCHAAHRSEEFFFFSNATGQWLRTVIGHEDEDLHPQKWIEATDGIIFRSNVLPYAPYWRKPRATENEANTSVHFPSSMLEEALNDRKTLNRTLQEWRDTGREFCDIGSPNQEGFKHPSLTSELFSEIQSYDVQEVRVLVEYGDNGTRIRLIAWRGGQFIQKSFKDFQSQFDMELRVLKRLSHPHLVYSFGKLEEGSENSFFMEYMSNDLLKLIFEINRVYGDERPPFVADATVDILLQVAKAIRHMHEKNVDVVHCDLKSQNILISEIITVDGVKHYLVKVADFGSALPGSSRYGPAGNFVAGNGTTRYSAPEVLRQLKDRTLPIDNPHKIDVYSFGIVAFEVLTGITIDLLLKKSPRKFKDGVINGTRRPPLHAECEKHGVFIQDEMLLSLIESCWNEDPSERPDFDAICEKLDKVRERKLQTDPPRQQNPIMTSSSKMKRSESRTERRYDLEQAHCVISRDDGVSFTCPKVQVLRANTALRVEVGSKRSLREQVFLDSFRSATSTGKRLLPSARHFPAHEGEVEPRHQI